MFQVVRDQLRNSLSSLRTNGSPRLVGFALALLAEAGLILVVLSLGWSEQDLKPKDSHLVSMAFKSETRSEKPKPPEARPAAARAAVQQSPRPTSVAAVQPAPSIAPPPIIPVPRDQLASFDISRLPRQPARPAAPGKGQMGPADLGVPGDSKRVGTAPGGQPMYAASWFREPYDDELSGYLSTAQGPGWALIACRTASDFRVEDCVGLDEYPDGSKIQRAVLAAAWQFRVRPPRVGGVSQVGSWVRIRIDYTERRN